MIIPLVLLVLSLGVLVETYLTTGDFINRGVSLKGGVQVTVFSEKNINTDALEYALSEDYPGRDINVRALQSAGSQIGFTVAIDLDVKEQEEILPLIEKIGEHTNLELKEDDYNIELIGSSLGSSFFHQTVTALIIAFTFMGAIVFYYFSDKLKVKLVAFVATLINAILIFKYFFTNIPMTIISIIIIIALLFLYLKESAPSFAVILAIVADILITLAIVNLMGIKLSTAGIAAFLMLIGYSVDTDILLSTRVLKRSDGTVIERTIGAMKTGLLMSATTIAAVMISIFITQSETLQQIMIIILVGLLVDLVNTWIQNAGLLRWYLEKKHKTGSHDY